MVGGDGAGDAHQIGCSILDDLLCCLWLGDAAGTDDVTVDGCRDSLGKRPVICFAREPGGAASTDARRQVENGDARVVKCACGFDTLRNGETPFVELKGGWVVGNAESDHEWQVFMHSCHSWTTSSSRRLRHAGVPPYASVRWLVRGLRNCPS